MAEQTNLYFVVDLLVDKVYMQEKYDREIGKLYVFKKFSIKSAFLFFNAKQERPPLST